MDIENPFTFFTEDRKTHLEIIVPGRPTKQTWKIHWDKSLEKGRNIITKEGRAEFFRYYEKHGFLAGYDSETIHKMKGQGQGWTVSAPWIVNINRMYWRLFEMSAYWALADRLWRPMFFTLTENMERYPYTEFVLPALPRVVTMDFVDKWYQANQNEASYFGRIQKKSEQTRIIPQEEDDKIILKIKDHPFVHQPVQRIFLYPTYPKNFPKRLSIEDQEFLRLKLLRRDAYRLKNLTDNERTRLFHLQPISSHDTFLVHWTRWLIFNGDMSAQNAILVSRDTEIKYKTLIQKPFDDYWERNWERLSKTGKKIFVDIPIPLTEYRPAPIRPVRTKRQKRHYLNRMTQLAAAEYQRED
ncbi:MAG: hypothetical protein IKS41_04250 [Alphaproteobacteria bacterium]|nr:hypothetical protein [Alphaproteobacteria bacterium]